MTLRVSPFRGVRFDLDRNFDLKRSGVAACGAVAVAILGPGHAALIPVDVRAAAIDTGRDRVDGRGAGKEAEVGIEQGIDGDVVGADVSILDVAE